VIFKKKESRNWVSTYVNMFDFFLILIITICIGYFLESSTIPRFGLEVPLCSKALYYKAFCLLLKSFDTQKYRDEARHGKALEGMLKRYFK
jgi:hypothetical protein